MTFKNIDIQDRHAPQNKVSFVVIIIFFKANKLIFKTEFS